MQSVIDFVREDIGRLNRYHYGKCATLLQKLDAVGVLDETLVWMGFDMGAPAATASQTKANSANSASPD